LGGSRQRELRRDAEIDLPWRALGGQRRLERRQPGGGILQDRGDRQEDWAQGVAGDASGARSPQRQRRSRKSWECGTRTHLQLRKLSDSERDRFRAALEQALAPLWGVRWARVNPYLNRVIVEHDAALVSAHELEERVAEVERRLGLAALPWTEDVFAASNQEPVQRAAIELAADLVSLGLSTALRRSDSLRWPIDVDLAALLALLESVPRIRETLERRMTQRGAELFLELSKASVNTLLRSEMGPVAALLRHVLSLREARALRAVWIRREAEFCEDPAGHPRRRRKAEPRPAPLRPGPVERYGEGAVPAALAAFGAEALVTQNLEAAVSAILGGLPRAAHLGRWAYLSQLAAEFASRDVLVLDRSALERLDRIDCVLLSADSVCGNHPGFERLVDTARRAHLKVRVVGRPEDGAPWARRVERVPARSLVEAVRNLQGDGSGVLVVHDGPSAAYDAADVSLALSSVGPPWGAHLVANRGWDDAALLVEAALVAREAAEHSVELAVAEAATSLALLFGGLDRTTTRRIMVTANVASLFAVGNALRLAHRVQRPPLPERPEQVPWHALSPEDCLARWKVDPEQGLSENTAKERSTRPADAPSDGRLLAQKMGAELANPMTPILAGGAVLSALVGSVVDAGLIGGALGLNAVIGGVQGFRTEKAVLALEKREERPIRVRRAGQERRVLDVDLVPGDVLLLEAGDVVPADCRILSGSSVEVDESSLTGESQPVRKRVEATPDAALADRACMLYEGSSLNVGSVEALVVATGQDTEAGRARLAGEEGEAPPGVEARLQYLSRLTAPVAGVSALAMTASGLLRRRAVEGVVTSAVGLGVASVPEGLPVLATLAQLAAAERLSTRGALVRNPRALEALGRMDVLCADKTGTLTEGQIRLRVVSDGTEERALDDLGAGHERVLRVALRASPVPNGSPLPHPTDQALVDGARAHGVAPEEGLERRAELPFEPARGLHATLETREDDHHLGVKGAPEVVLPRATHVRRGDVVETLDEEARARWLEQADRMAGEGYRVLAVAERSVRADFELNDDSVEELVLCGFLGYADPVRGSARGAIENLGKAGVRVVMITGDHPGTAESIARELGLLNGHRVMTGSELDELDDADLAERIGDVAVFARVAPLQKVRIVRVLQAQGHAVGMTGDGANDAPAIQLADVGIALGEGSTSAARGAADLIVSDGRIETILKAVLEGRALWTRVRDAVSILVGGNLGEIAFTVAGGLSSGKSPLNARQLLLVNLVTDTLPALAIAVRPPANESMEALLRAGPEASLGQELERDMMLRGLVTASAAGVALQLARRTGATDEEASTVGLLTLTATQLGQTFALGGRTPAVLGASLGSLSVLLAVVETAPLSRFFGCQPLGVRRLAQALGVGAAAAGLARLGDAWLTRLAAEESQPATLFDGLRRASGFVRKRLPSDPELAQSAAELVQVSRRVARNVQRWASR
jgi:cation-transporting ATPase I